MENKDSNTGLKRTIGTFGLACAVINITIGTGIFVLPALVAENLGAAAILAFGVCGLLIFFIALCFAEVGTRITGDGGTYTYIETAFGPFAGFLANNIFLFGSCVLSDAAVANGLSQTLGYFFPIIDSAAVRPFFFLVLFGGLAIINIRSTKNGLRFIQFTTFAKLTPLLLIILFGGTYVSGANLHWEKAFTINDIGAASLILFFAFLGIETAVSNSGEIKNPRRVIPRGILWGLGVVLFLYISVQVITQGILGRDLLLYKEAPIAEVSRRLFGYFGITLVTIGIAVSMLGSISGEILAIPRVLFAGAKNGIFPAVIGKVHPRFFTPYISIIVYASLGYLLSVFGGFKQLIILSSASSLLIYLGVVLATIRLRYKKTMALDKAFIVPGGLIVPLIATAAIIWLLSNLSQEEMTGIGIALGVLSLVYLGMKWFKQKKVHV